MKARRQIWISSFIMLLIALPMMVFTFNMIYSASPHDVPGDGLASLGLLIGAVGYIFSLVVAIAGLSFANKPHLYKWCKGLGYILIILLGITLILARAYFTFTMLPLAILIIPYILGARKE